MTPPGIPDFTIVLRGYDRAEVDRYLSSSEPGSPPPFTIVLRGYDRAEVDTYIAALQ